MFGNCSLMTRALHWGDRVLYRVLISFLFVHFVCKNVFPDLLSWCPPLCNTGLVWFSIYIIDFVHLAVVPLGSCVLCYVRQVVGPWSSYIMCLLAGDCVLYLLRWLMSVWWSFEWLAVGWKLCGGRLAKPVNEFCDRLHSNTYCASCMVEMLFILVVPLNKQSTLSMHRVWWHSWYSSMSISVLRSCWFWRNGFNKMCEVWQICI